MQYKTTSRHNTSTAVHVVHECSQYELHEHELWKWTTGAKESLDVANPASCSKIILLNFVNIIKSLPLIPTIATKICTTVILVGRP